MFTISKEPTFTHDVTARVPVDGGYVEESFKATFRAIPPEEAEAYDLTRTDTSVDFLKRIIVKLHDIGDAEAKPVEYSDAVRDQVLRLPWARSALAMAYFSAISGARLGN